MRTYLLGTKQGSFGDVWGRQLWIFYIVQGIVLDDSRCLFQLYDFMFRWQRPGDTSFSTASDCDLQYHCKPLQWIEMILQILFRMVLLERECVAGCIYGLIQQHHSPYIPPNIFKLPSSYLIMPLKILIWTHSVLWRANMPWNKLSMAEYFDCV